MNQKQWTKRKRRIALELRINGFTYRKIGKVLGITANAVTRLCKPPKSIIHMVYGRAKWSQEPKGELKCESCGKPTQEGHVHHIRIVVEQMDDYNKIENLVYVCPICHGKVHAAGRQMSEQINQVANSLKTKVINIKNSRK